MDSQRICFEIMSDHLKAWWYNALLSVQKVSNTDLLISFPRSGCTYAAGLSLEESTDVEILTRELTRLEKLEREMHLTMRTRYSPKEERDKLKEELTELVSRAHWL